VAAHVEAALATPSEAGKLKWHSFASFTQSMTTVRVIPVVDEPSLVRTSGNRVGIPIHTSKSVLTDLAVGVSRWRKSGVCHSTLDDLLG
jgi:hypothetical protein